MHFAYSHKKANDLLVATLSRKVLALVVVLALSLGAFVLSAGEAHAEQKSTVVPPPEGATDSVVPPSVLTTGETPPPVQAPALKTALPKTPPPLPTSSTVLVAETQLGPLTAKPSPTPTIAGGTAVVNDLTPPPMPTKKAMEDLARPVERQQAAAPTPTAATRVDPKDRQRTSRASSEPLARGPLSEPPALSKEEEKKDPLSLPKQGRPSVLLPATFEGSGGEQAQQLLPNAQEAALGDPTTTTLTATPLPHRASSAANNSAAVPIDHPAVSPASASTQWEIAPVAEGLARYMSPPWPSSSIGTARDSVVQLVQSSAAHAQQEARVSDLASFQASSSAWREISSEGTPAPPAPQRSSPSSPSPEPSDYYSFALSGGSELSTSVGPLLLGILALGGWFLLRPAFRTYLAWCKIPKPSSALLMPLERPG